jgi:hypothetical protein
MYAIKEDQRTKIYFDIINGVIPEEICSSLKENHKKMD